MWLNSDDKPEPNTPLARSFQEEIEAALGAANGTKVKADCWMIGNVNFAVSCRVSAPIAENLIAQLLASGWSYAERSSPSSITLRKASRQISVSQMPSTNEVSIAMRLVKS
ncbi:hypothetical protein AACH06_29190 [Ideonella sp. DXS29W]|uniref:Uncharacterized protein n=1 Tax=Ideonella lacteola TaxID=2984193 RepID=A0ABU9C235_9BURK